MNNLDKGIFVSPFDRLQQLWPMPSNPLPITIIGAGGVVKDAHLPAYRKWGLPVAGIYDPDMGRAKSLAERFDIPIVHGTLDEAMQTAEDFVLDIAVPPQALAEVLPEIPKGRTALIQKPFGTGLGEANKLAAILQQNEVTAATNFQLRFTPTMLALSDAINKGMFGAITELEVRLACRTPWQEWPFMRALEAVEIPLHSIHYLDWIRALLGQPEKVYAKSLPHPDHQGLADARSSIILDYGDTVRCCLSLNHTHKWGPKREEATLRIEGTKGAAIVGLGYLVNFPEGRPETLEMIVEGGEWQSVSLAGARMPDAFAGVMANLQRFAAGEDKKLETSVSQTLATMALAGACLTSSASGEAVAVGGAINNCPAYDRAGIGEKAMSSTDAIILSGEVGLTGIEAAHPMDRLKQAFPAIGWKKAPQGQGRAQIDLKIDREMAEGAFSIEVAPLGIPRIHIRGGSLSGLIYGVNELIENGGDEPGKMRVARQNIKQSPGLAYRTFWTWDHSSNWELSQIGQQEIGVFNPYSKPPGGFLADYQRMVDFCSLNRIAAIVIYGFLRDSHGGIEAAQELCRYANQRGVRIIPGIAIGAYGGVYWEGEHKYNLSTWLKKNPQFAATMEKGVGFQLEDLSFPLNFPRSDYTVSACPSAPETMEWMEEAVAWLAETFEIGGINIESGDYGVCGCERCVARRDNPDEAARRVSDLGDSWSHTDMAENFPPLFTAANAKRDDLWIYCEMQWDNLLDPVASKVQSRLPEGAIYQHTANQSFWHRLRGEIKKDYVENLPTQPNVLRCQFACQWNGDERTQRYALNARIFADMAQTAAGSAMRGLTVWGEPSPYHATVEISYLAFARFTYDPQLTWEQFLSRDLAPLFGGVEGAQGFIEIAEELDENQVLSDSRLAELAETVRTHYLKSENEAARRWLSLADQIARRQFMGA